MEFRLLGPFEVVRDGTPAGIGAARLRTVLAMLLLASNRTVAVSRLIEAVWDEDPPRTAKSQVHICVSALRRQLSGAGGGSPIATRPSGYLISVPDDAVDVRRFEVLVAEAAAQQPPEQAVKRLRAGLALWRGPAADGVCSRVVQAAATRLNESRLAALEDCLDLELQLGRHHDLTGELRELVAEHPLRERLCGQLMLALYRSGRQAEALESFRTTRETLAGELGLDPGEELRRLEQAVLASHPALGLPDGARHRRSSGGSGGGHPRLPAAPGWASPAGDLAMASATLSEPGSHPEDRRATHEAALDAVRRTGNRHGEASLLYSLALLALGERPSDASWMLGRAQALFDELGDVHGLALTCSGLAVVDRLSGRYTEALVRYRAALAGFEQVGDLVGKSHVRRDMAQIHMDQQRYDVAEQLLHEALAVCRKLGAHRVTAQTEYQQAELHLRTGRLDEAERSFEAARQAAGDARDTAGQAYAMLGLGVTRSARGEPDRAERDLRAALDLADQTDNLLLRSRTRLALAELDAARDRAAAGMARVEHAGARTRGRVGSAGGQVRLGRGVTRGGPRGSVPGDVDAGPDPELGQDVGDVDLDGPQGQEQPTGDLRVRPALGDPVGHLQLGRGQRLPAGSRPPAAAVDPADAVGA